MRDDISLWFWFTFPWWLVVMSIFSYSYWPSSLEKCRHSVPLPFSKSGYLRLFSVLCCKSFWYILDINPLADMRFANIPLAHSCLFTWSWSPGLCRHFQVWCGPTCLFLLLLPLFLCQIQKNHCQHQCQGTFPLCFLLGVLQFLVSHFSVRFILSRSLCMLSFHCSACGYQLFQHHVSKRLPLLHCLFLATF